ncbi:MAG: enoyl-CoA hydratase [Desulforhabdus sp.]|jgi:enoyl-CoA hydratase/carnithine racemase|nr:enoyl-CoA hydratase [Desulforhabdus sp.]
MEAVLLEKEGPIGWLTLNRPEKRNALSLELMSTMLEKLDAVGEDADIRVLVIRGNGKIFSAGHDLKEMAGAEKGVHHFRNIFMTCNRMMLRLHELPQPVIAQVHGIATAAGCQLVAACDLAIAEDNARFATPGVKIGLFCTTPMIPLVRAIGRKRAMEMLMTGRFISAQEAERFGLVNRIVPPDQLAEETKKWALEMAQFSKFALALGKHAFYGQVDLNERSAYDFAKEVIAMNCMAEDAQEGMHAFLEKREPKWQDR